MEEKQIERKEAWLPEETLKRIENYLILLGCEAKVFEFGSGTSTKWLEQMSSMVISVEHDLNYFSSLYKYHHETVANINIIFQETPYNKVIEKYNDEIFDLILVDGRNRQACIRSAIPKLKSGGWLVLDNSERDYYKPAIDMMADWQQSTQKQENPDKYGFTYPSWQCTIFIKPLKL